MENMQKELADMHTYYETKIDEMKNEHEGKMDKMKEDYEGKMEGLQNDLDGFRRYFLQFKFFLSEVWF